MLILLPPSETKRDGGDGAPLDIAALAHPRLAPVRRRLVRELGALARRPEEMMARLKLGPKLAFEVERNRTLAKAPTMPAMDRYTGVLYEALDAPSLDAAARAFAGPRLRVHSALFGLVAGDDAIPAYRLSHDSRLDAPTLKARWAAPVARELAERAGSLVLDLRSEAYVHLGPAPRGSWFLRVVSEGPDGVQRALNHFNKKSKGEFTRALLTAGHDFTDVDELLDWAPTAGLRLTRSTSAAGELVLVA